MEAELEPAPVAKRLRVGDQREDRPIELSPSADTRRAGVDDGRDATGGCGSEAAASAGEAPSPSSSSKVLLSCASSSSSASSSERIIQLYWRCSGVSDAWLG